MFLKVHCIHFHAPKISIRHILISLQIFKRLLNISSTFIQINLLRCLCLPFDEQTRKLKKQVLATRIRIVHFSFE
jgi:hypothetical protein